MGRRRCRRQVLPGGRTLKLIYLELQLAILTSIAGQAGFQTTAKEREVCAIQLGPEARATAQSPPAAV